MLLIPVFAGQVVYPNYETLVIAAIAAAVLGGLRSIPLAYLGGLLLGVVQQLLNRYLPTQSVLASGLRPALPFIVLFVVIIFSPANLLRPPATDPLAGVDPPPPAPAHAERSDELTKLTRGFAVVFFAIVGYYLFFHASDAWVDLAVRAAILSVIFLSITVITGFAGQISLCQAIVRRHRCVRDRAARVETRTLGDPGHVHRRAHRGRGRRGARAACAAAGRDLPLARHARVRVLLPERDVELHLGRWRAAAGASAPAAALRRSTSARARTRATTSSCCSRSSC